MIELSDNNQLYKIKSQRNPQITRNYKKALRKQVSKKYKNNPQKRKALIKYINSMDPDHVWELQLGGPDRRCNLKMAEKYTNRKIGINLGGQLKSVGDGKRVKVVVEY